MSDGNLQALLNSYDDIPALMSKIREGNTKASRFHPGKN
jgi:hypothetical protein